MINLDSVFISVEIFDCTGYVQRSGPKTQHLLQLTKAQNFTTLVRLPLIIF